MIGILAGMGPKSTAPFLDKVIQICQQEYGAKCDMDFPPIMIYSCPTPFYVDRPLDYRALGQAIVAGVQKLAGTGVEIIAVPCNVAHLYWDEITAAVQTPVLNMVDLTLGSLPQGSSEIAVLATEATLASGIYQQGLAASHKTFVTRPDWQQAVNSVLNLIKSGENMERAVEEWRQLLQSVEKTAHAAVIACTDLNLAADQVTAALPLVDSSFCLARAVAASYYDKKQLLRQP